MAGNRIKGITLEFNGDTTNLQKSLSGVDKELRNVQSQLKDVDKLLKLDPKNTELLEQKQRMLGESIGLTKEKLETLKSAAEQADQALKDGTMSQKDYDALQREIAETETSLKNLEKAAKDTETAMSNLPKVADKLGAISKKTEEVGKSLTKNVTAPIAGLGAASFGAFKEVDSGMDIIKRKVGTIATDFDDLNRVYEDIFGSMPVTAEQAGSAIGEVATRFQVSGQELEDLSRLFLKFSSITGEDVTSSVASVDKIMEKYGEDAGSTQEVLGMFANLSQRTGISVSTLTGSLESNGAQLKQMGFSLNESAELLARFEQSGIDSSAAMTGLKKTVQNATKDGKDARTALEEMITTIQNSQSEIGALEYATELFGAKAAPEMAQAIREGRFDLEDLSTSMDYFSGVVDDTFSATQDAGDEAKIAFNNLKLAGAELGQSIGTVLSPVIQKLSELFKGLSNWFSSLSPQQQDMIVKIALIAATIGPLLIVLAKLIAAVQTILTIMPAVKGAILAVNAAMAANPIAMVVLAIAGLVAAFKLLWDNCEEFREFWGDMWEALQEGASIVIDGIGTAFEQLGEGFQTVGDGVMLLFGTIGDTFSALGDLFGDICSTTGEAFSAWGDGIKTVFSTIWDFIKGIINTILSGINGMIGGIESAINWVIGGMNKLHWEIPSWVPGIGGKGFGFDIPEVNFGRIPYLAQGAVIPPNNPFLAVLGDQQSGTNIEAPLNTIKQALIEAMGSTAAAGQVVIPVYIGQERIETIVANASKRNSYRSGGR